MAQQHLDIGTAPNDGTGDDLRTAGSKIEANFNDLYGLTSTLSNLINGQNQIINGQNQQITDLQTNLTAVVVVNNAQQLEINALKIDNLMQTTSVNLDTLTADANIEFKNNLVLEYKDDAGVLIDLNNELTDFNSVYCKLIVRTWKQAYAPNETIVHQTLLFGNNKDVVLMRLYEKSAGGAKSFKVIT